LSSRQARTDSAFGDPNLYRFPTAGLPPKIPSGRWNLQVLDNEAHKRASSPEAYGKRAPNQHQSVYYHCALFEQPAQRPGTAVRGVSEMFGWIKWLWKQFQMEKVKLQRWEAQDQRIARLSVEQAREEALQVLQDERVFRLVPASGVRDAQILAQLPADVQELAVQYDRIELVGTEDEWRGADGLDFSQITPAELREGFLRIGRLAPDTDVYTEVCIRPGEKGVYELYLDAAEVREYASVYHWILNEYWTTRVLDEVEEEFGEG